MTRLKPPHGTTAELTTAVVQERDLAYDSTLDRFVMGDGVLPAGKPLAFKSEVDTIPSGSDASAANVTTTGPITKTLADWTALIRNLGSTAISTAMAPVVQAATLAQAAARLGSPFWFNITNPLYGCTTASADNYAAFNLATAACNAAGGGTIYVPKGSFTIQLPSATGLTAFAAGTRIKGEGVAQSVLNIECTTTNFLHALNASSGDFSIEDVTINFVIETAATQALIAPGSRMSFRRSKFVSNGTASDVSILINWPTGATASEGLLIEDCYVTGWHAVFNKENAAQSTQTRHWFVNSYFYDNVSHHLSFNSPHTSSFWSDVHVIACKFGGQTGLSGGTGHMLAFARITDFEVIGCTFLGETDGEAIHIEDLCARWVIADCVMKVSSSQATYGKGIVVLNGGAGDDVPTSGRIRGCVIEHTGATTTTAIEFLDTTGTHPIGNVEVEDVTAIGFSVGVTIATDMRNLTLSRLKAVSCTTGVSAGILTMGLRDLTVTDCTTGIAASRGMCGKVYVRGTLTTLANASVGLIAVRGWSRDVHAQTLDAAGDTNITLMSVAALMTGRFAVMAQQNGTHYMHADVDFKWDGSTDTDTVVNKLTSGHLDLSGIDVNSGNLRLLVFNAGSAKTGCDIRVDFEGSHVFT